MEKFVEHWLYEVIGAIWDWHRLAYALMAGYIHFHGLTKLRYDPRLCKRTEIVLNVHNTKQMVFSNNYELQSREGCS